MSSSPTHSVRRRIGIYLFHSAVASIGVWIIAGSLAWLLSFRLQFTFADKFFDQPFVGEIIFGLILGFLVNSRLNSKSAWWAWVIPLIWMFVLMTDDIRSPEQGGVLYTIWMDMFSINHGDLGLGGALGTSVFYSSVAYSLGAWIAFWQRC